MSEPADPILHLPDEASLQAVARRLAGGLRHGAVVYLRGELGAGKTTFARALLQELGVSTRIKSPTYSLVESYILPGLSIQHLDLYRIAEAAELEWLGLADLHTEQANLMLVEWPERGTGQLPAADLLLELQHHQPGRRLRLESQSALGAACLDAVNWSSAR